MGIRQKMSQTFGWQQNKYLYINKGLNMKVLIETITNRKGYKNFKDINCLNEFLNKNRKKIKTFKILKETYNGTFEELLQNVMKQADYLGKMIEYAFFEMTNKSNKYNKLLRAMGLAAEIQGLVRGYIKV